MTAPGGYRRPRDVVGPFARCAARLKPGAIVLLDKRVAALHPGLLRAVRARRPGHLALVPGGERLKRMETVSRLLGATAHLPRGTPVVAVGGGTVGDLAAVFAHLHKRGAPLVQVPTTLLAAVDSSLGGKGAVDVGGLGAAIKNAAGVFHYPEERWVCPELFGTLSPAQLREGEVEAWKMAVCLDRRAFDGWRRRRPSLRALVGVSRRLKLKVCDEDPYEATGIRRVLNFGHTFGHALESLSGFRLSHGDAVGLGILCALDVGRRLGVTGEGAAAACEAVVPHLGRAALAQRLRGIAPRRLAEVLRADKKGDGTDALTLVLLREPGRTQVARVPGAVWRGLLPSWRSGVRP